MASKTLEPLPGVPAEVARALAALWTAPPFFNPTGIVAVDAMSTWSRKLSDVGDRPYAPLIAAVKTDQFYVGDATFGFQSVPSASGVYNKVALLPSGDRPLALAVGANGIYTLARFTYGSCQNLYQGAVSGTPHFTEVIRDMALGGFWVTGPSGIHAYDPYGPSWDQRTSVPYRAPLVLPAGSCALLPNFAPRPSARWVFQRRSDDKLRWSDSAALDFHEGPVLAGPSLATPVYDCELKTGVVLTDTKIYLTDGENAAEVATLPSGPKTIFRFQGKAVVAFMHSRNGHDELLFTTHTERQALGPEWFIAAPGLVLTHADAFAGCGELVITSQAGGGILLSPRICELADFLDAS